MRVARESVFHTYGIQKVWAKREFFAPMKFAENQKIAVRCRLLSYVAFYYVDLITFSLLCAWVFSSSLRSQRTNTKEQKARKSDYIAYLREK